MPRSHRLALRLLLIKLSRWIGSAVNGFSNAVFVSYGSGASAAVRLLLRELVISKGANISAHLTAVYLGGPPLALDLDLFWLCGL